MLLGAGDFGPRSAFQKLARLDRQHLRDALDEVEVGGILPAFQFVEIAPAYLGLVGQGLLGHASGVPPMAHVSGEGVPQSHAGNQANCPIYTTRIVGLVWG